MTEEQENLLVPMKDYLKAGIHIGTKFKNKYMMPFIYRIRPDGLSVLNLQAIDERLGIAARFMANYEPEDILVVCRRENGWKVINKFAEVTGCKAYPGRYPPGILTNPSLKNYVEVKLLIIVDSWPDRNAINDAKKKGIPIIGLCDTNNQFNNLDLVIPANNKGKSSLALIFYILAKEFLKNKGKVKSDSELEFTLDDFMSE
jgi:small subunit ribosomal protein S2